jgi:hypothetical protein
MIGRLLGKLPRPSRRAWIALSIVALLGAGAAALFATSSVFPRVPPGSVAILIRKTGRPLPSGAVIAPRARPGELPYQGIQEDVLLPGWYPTGYNAFDWDWAIVPQTVIPPGNVGVVTRVFGEELPENQLFADENPADAAAGIVRRGPLLATLAPGIHAVNSWAYQIRVFPIRAIEPGNVGVVCRRYGVIPNDRAAFLAPAGERGVQEKWLPPGTYNINPIAEEVRNVSCQSRRLDLGSGGRTKFPSSDGFDVTVSGTVEWTLDETKVPLLYCKYGDATSVEQRLLLPAARTSSRLQGSRKPAREFISGVTRQTFQDDFQRELKAVVEPEGLKLQSVLISGIVPPDEIAKPIREREAALLQREEYRQQIETERTRIELTSQMELEKRPAALAGARAKSVELLSQANRERQVQLIQAQNSVDVARFEQQAAQLQADAIVATGEAEALAARLKTQSQAESLRRRVEAHGGGAAYARATLLEKLAPKFTTILGTTQGPIAEIFSEFRGRSAPESRPGSLGMAGDLR